MQLFVKMINDYKLLTTSAKSLDVFIMFSKTFTEQTIAFTKKGVDVIFLNKKIN